MKANHPLRFALLAVALALAGCDYQVPLTSSPTRPVEPQVLGDWIGIGDETDTLHLRQLDERTYIAVVDGDAYRVHHSDFAGLPLVSTQDLNSSDRKYCLYTWTLQDDGKRLVLRRVSTRVVSDEINASDELQRQLQLHLQDPALLSEEIAFRRK
jgi:hypothetical protein